MTLRLGLMLPPGLVDPRPVGSIARTAETAGFAYLAGGEHLFFRGACSNSLVVLAAVAGMTRRIRLLSAVTLLPLYPAALAAKMAATLHQVSGGRFELGVGAGGENPAEFEACGVPVDRRGEIMDESLATLRRLLDGEPLAGEGTPRLDPVPAQPVRLWIGGRRGASIRRAGRHADVWLPHLCTPEQMRRSLEQVRTEAERAGRDPERIDGAVVIWGAVDRDGARAQRTTAAALRATYGQDFDGLIGKYCAAGSPEQVVDRLGRYAEAGATSAVFAPACRTAELPGVLELLATEVLPAVGLERDAPADTAGRGGKHHA